MSENILDRTGIGGKKKSLIKVAAFFLVLIILAVIWNVFFFSPLKISGDSMNPSLSEGDVVFLNKFAYNFGDIERYDIVAFPYKYDNSRTLVKRVVGLPNEKIEMRDGVLYIDDKDTEEYYGIYLEVDSDMREYTLNNWGPVILGDDEVFVLGDNRNLSDDSRSSDVGAVDIDDIIGKVAFRILPFNSIGSMKGQ